MRHAVATCKKCGSANPVFEIPPGGSLEDFLNPNWQRELECPECGVAARYTYYDLREIEDRNSA